MEKRALEASFSEIELNRQKLDKMKNPPHLPFLIAFVALATLSAEANAKAPKDIVAVASGAGEFKTLVAAVKAAGSGEEPRALKSQAAIRCAGAKSTLAVRGR